MKTEFNIVNNGENLTVQYDTIDSALSQIILLL